MTDDLVQFLRDRLDEDERAAQVWPELQRGWEVHGLRQLDYASGASEPVTPISVGGDGYLGWERIAVKRDVDGLAEHIARHDPARVLREVEAKRRTLDDCEGLLVGRYYEESGELAHDVLRNAALPYTDHPDYREDWRP